MDPVRRARRTGHRAASTTLSASGRPATSCSQPEDVGRFLAARAGDEPDLARVERQQAFWTAWLPLVRDAGERALPGEVETGIGRFVRVIAAGEGGAEAIPVGREDTADGVRYRPDAGRLGRFLSVTIPYPTSPAPGVRIRVRLLNGTGDPGLTERAARQLVASGAEIAVVGNAATLTEPETRFVHVGGRPEALARLAPGEPRRRAPRTGRVGATWGGGGRRRHRRDRDPRPRCRGHPREGADL